MLAIPIALASYHALVPAERGLDPSWRAGIHVATRTRLDFGTDVLFTYGPLGFLAETVHAYTSTALLAVAYGLVVRYLLAALVVRSLQRSLPLWLALGLTFVVASAGHAKSADVLVVPAFFLAAVALLRGDWARHERWLVPALGALAGMHLLVKFNAGLALIGITAVTASALVWLDRKRWTTAVASGAAGLAAFLVGWIATGNPLSGIGDFVTGSLDVASGYSEAMPLDLVDAGEQYQLAAVVTLVAIALVVVGTRGWARPRRIGVALVAFGFAYSSFKHGFVRIESHSHIYFLAVLVGVTAFSWPRRASAAVVAAIAVCFVGVAQTHPQSPTQMVRPLASLGAVGDDLTTLAIPGRSYDAIERNRFALRGSYGLDDAVELLLEGRTVHMHPWEGSVAWAYPEIDWRPLPVFQAYSAYNAALDDGNADVLRGRDAPDYVIRTMEAVDNRNPHWESPAVMVELLCRYQEVDAGTLAPGWQILERGPDRCGRAATIDTVRARFGSVVRVPRADPGSLVVARIHGLADGAAFALRSQLFKAPVMTVDVEPGDGTYRLVPGTAATGLPVRAATGLGWTEPFAPPSVSALRVHASGFGVGDDLTVEFVAIPLRPAG